MISPIKQPLKGIEPRREQRRLLSSLAAGRRGRFVAFCAAVGVFCTV